MIDRNNKWAVYASALGLGAVSVLAFAPFGLWFLMPVTLAGLFLLIEGATPRRAALIGWLFGVGEFAAGTYWIHTSLHTFGKLPLWLAITLMAGLVMVMGLFMALFTWAAARWSPPRDAWVRRYLLFVPALWVLVELFRGWFLTGFPWLSVGYSQIDTPLAGYAPLLGMFGVGLAVAFTAGVVILACNAPARTAVAAGVAGGLVWALGWGAGFIGWSEPAGEPLEVAIVQGNVAQDRKWLPEERLPTMNMYLEMTDPLWGRDVVVWPEAAIPVLYGDVADQYLPLLEAEAVAHDTTLFMGLLRHERDTDRYYNGVLAMGEGQHRFYDKRHLVPFGEYFPVPGFVREWLRMQNLPFTDFAAGAARQELLRANAHPVGVSICYEDVFGRVINNDVPPAAFFINVSNDAWFGDSIAPHQHLEIARMRSLEFSRFTVRSTNNGISAFIAPDGRVVDILPQFERGVLEGAVEPRKGATPYAVAGNGPILAICLLLVLVFGPFRPRIAGGRTE